MTAGERLIAEGERRGLRRGEQRGERKGKASTLLKLLDQKFGGLPQPAVERISAADTAQLDRWFGRIFDARTLDELLAE